MQFFKIHTDPKINADMLPDYAVTKVNCREGIQILCDCGHNVGVIWEGQNKAYSIWHVEVRKVILNRSSFLSFIEHLEACMYKYKEYKGKLPIYYDKLQLADIKGIADKLPVDRTTEEFMLDYLIRGKASKMSEKDLERLRSYQK